MTRHCGLVTIAGRPNVGKSTLLNRLVGQKLAITAPKPQTTRHRLLGIVTEGDYQAIYVDTPGIHVDAPRALNRVLNRTASSSLADVDLVLLLVQAGVWNDDDRRAWELVTNTEVAFCLVVNKVDQVRDKSRLLPYLAGLPEHERLLDVLLVSARKGSGIDTLIARVHAALPEAPFRYPDDEITDRSARFLAAECLREQLTRQLSDELPYALTVEIEHFEESGDLTRIGAVVWVDKASQKGIVIGRGGQRLKEVGRRARLAMEALFSRRVHLDVWVRVKAGWADDLRTIDRLGHGPD